MHSVEPRPPLDEQVRDVPGTWLVVLAAVLLLRRDLRAGRAR